MSGAAGGGSGAQLEHTGLRPGWTTSFCAGAVLEYVRRHAVDRLTVCGGFAKLSELAAGHLDPHSARSQADKGFLAGLARRGGAGEALAAGVPPGDPVATAARDQAPAVLRAAPVAVDVIRVDRAGTVVGPSGIARVGIA